MLFRILFIVAVIFLLVKYRKNQRGLRPGKSGSRVVRSELAQLRARYHRIADFFDPQTEREKLAGALHHLMNTGSPGNRTEAYRNGLDAVRNIIPTREEDARRISAFSQLRRRYEASGDRFTDGLRELIESQLERGEELRSNEHFAVGIDELKLIGRLVPWLIEKGEAGRDNSVHWAKECREMQESIRRQVADERGWWNLI